MRNLLRAGLVLVCSVPLLACGGERADNPATTDLAAGEGSATRSTLDRVAGTWQVRAWNLARDSLPGFTLVARPDTTGWRLSLQERSDIPVRVIAASGDVFVIETEPYESVLRPGVQVVLHLEHTMQGDQLEGHLLALYDVAGAGAVLRGRTEGTRVR